MRDVRGPGEVGRDLDAEELEALHLPCLLPVYGKGGVLGTLRFSEVHDEFLGFGGVEDQLVEMTPVCQMLNACCDISI